MTATVSWSPPLKPVQQLLIVKGVELRANMHPRFGKGFRQNPGQGGLSPRGSAGVNFAGKGAVMGQRHTQRCQLALPSGIQGRSRSLRLSSAQLDFACRIRKSCFMMQSRCRGDWLSWIQVLRPVADIRI